MHRFCTTTLVALAGLISAGLAAAADPDPRVECDSLSRKTLTGWASVEYRPATLGLAGGSVEIAFAGTSRGQPLSGKCTYEWDSSTPAAPSQLTWEPAAFGQRMKREGWSRDEFDADFLATHPLAAFAGCTLTAARNEASIVISVKGQAKNGIRRLTFDKNGVLTKEEYEIKDDGFEMKFSLEPVYEKRDKQYLKTRETFKMAGQWGKIESVSVFSYTEVEGVLLPAKIEERSTWEGSPAGNKTITWSGWKLRKKPAKSPK